MICPKCGREAIFLKHSPTIGVCRHCLAELLLTAALFRRDQEEELYEDDSVDFAPDGLAFDPSLEDEEEAHSTRKPPYTA